MLQKFLIHAFLLLYSTVILGQIRKQPDIQFETSYIDAVDRWVVLPQKTSELNYLLGYIYLDEIVGFSFTYYDVLTIDSFTGWKLQRNLQNCIIKSTLDARTPLVCVLTNGQINHLRLPEKPIWIQLQTEHPKTVEELVLIGYHYNKANKSEKALPFLEDALSINPKSKNLTFELSFAYNALGLYEKAIDLLKSGLKQETANYMLYRELGYALLQLNNFEEAESNYELGMKICTNENQKREMAIDMAQTFYAIKDEKQFEKWAAILRK
jgi:tetratricopeptide (TPR) repeat protein